MLIINGALTPFALLLSFASIFPFIFPFFIIAPVANFGDFLLRNYIMIALGKPLFVWQSKGIVAWIERRLKKPIKIKASDAKAVWRLSSLFNGILSCVVIAVLASFRGSQSSYFNWEKPLYNIIPLIGLWIPLALTLSIIGWAMEKSNKGTTAPETPISVTSGN
jgi:hypothetical protein